MPGSAEKNPRFSCLEKNSKKKEMNLWIISTHSMNVHQLILKSHSRIHFKRSTTSLTFKSLSKYNRLWYLSYLKNPIEIISFLKAVQVKIKYNKSLLNKPNNSKKNLCHKKWVTLNSSKVSLKCMLWCNGIGFFVWNLFWDKKFNLPSTDCNRSRGTHCVCGEIIWTVALNLFHP